MNGGISSHEVRAGSRYGWRAPGVWAQACPQMSNANETYLLVEEVAALTRTPISSVRGWLAAGRLPYARPGRRVLIKRSDLDAFLRASTRNTPKEGAR